MNEPFYLRRYLSNYDKTYSETELLTASNFVVVLAEPSAGKTELMGSLARQLGTISVTTSKFGYVGAKAQNTPLVIDAFDELAKVDATSIYKILEKALATKPIHFYLSGRSSEWCNGQVNPDTF